MRNSPKTFSYSMTRSLYRAIAKGESGPRLNDAQMLEYVNKTFGLRRPVTSIRQIEG